MDLDALGPDTHNGASGLEDPGNVTASENNKNEDDEIQGEDQNHTQKKCSASVAGLNEDVKPKLGTPAHPNMSKPMAAGPKSKKPKGLKELVEIAHAEEMTHQKQIKLEIQKLKEKGSKAHIKAEVQKAMIEAKKEKAKQTHEVEMIKLQFELARFRQVAPGVGAGGTAMQLSQDTAHLPSLYPALSPTFNFGDGGQFCEMSGNESGGKESFDKL